VPPLDLDDHPVRSADVRAAVAAGDLAGARHLLGRSLAVVGERIDGGPAGVRLAFPIPMALPPAGRYAALIEPAWTPDSPPAASMGWAARAVVRGSATVGADDAGLVLTSRRPLPSAGRLRVTLTRRLG